MRRRAVLAMLGGAAVALPWAARAQQAERLRRVAVLVNSPGGLAEVRAGFIGQLAALGWIETSNIEIAIRVADGTAKLASAQAQELVSWAPEVVFTANSVSTRAVQQATRSIPIIFTNVSDAVGAGFVKSLAHPGGNITGFTNYEYDMGRKWVDLLQQIDPAATRVAVVYNPDNPGGLGHLKDIEAAAPRLGMRVARMANLGAAELSQAFDKLAGEGGAGVLVTPSAAGLAESKVIGLAARYRLVAIYPRRDAVTSGGLVSYGNDRVEAFQQAARYVDRILRGAKPDDLPVQAPTRYELVINLKTARALGLTLPPALLARADEVIE
jgi:putative ABC transport system substrate-binding protein